MFLELAILVELWTLFLMDGAEGHGARVLPVLGHLVPDLVRRKGGLQTNTKLMLTQPKS